MRVKIIKCLPLISCATAVLLFVLVFTYASYSGHSTELEEVVETDRLDDEQERIEQVIMVDEQEPLLEAQDDDNEGLMYLQNEDYQLDEEEDDADFLEEQIELQEELENLQAQLQDDEDDETKEENFLSMDGLRDENFENDVPYKVNYQNTLDIM